MYPLPILILLLATADVAFSEEAPSKEVDGTWYALRVKLTNSIDDAYSCVKRINKPVNDTVIDTVFYYKLNGESKEQQGYKTLRTLTGTECGQFIYAVEYKDDNDEVCSYIIEVTKQNNLIIYFLCEGPKIDTLCASQSETVTEELEKRCPESEGFITIDQTNC